MPKIIVLAPSAGGKSTLMRYLREHTNLNVREMDEEVMKENNDTWPEDNDHKDQVLVPRIVKKILNEDNIVYLASYVPEDLIKDARAQNFIVLLLKVELDELLKRNKERMTIEHYADATSWLKLQLDTFTKLQDKGIIDKVIDGNLPTKDIATIIEDVYHYPVQ
jgi:shikimate kinase